MRPVRSVLVAFALAVALTGCAGPAQAPVSSAPAIAPPAEVQQPPSTVQQPSSPGALRLEALALMEAKDYAGAAVIWKQLIEQEPSADNWNELSFAYLQAQQWDAAAKAGKQALKIEKSHPFALYNTGMALLEGGEPCSAETYLWQSAELQPDRSEPQVGLARAYIVRRDYEMALKAASRAAALDDEREDVKAVVAVAGDLRKAPPPQDLATVSIAQWKDADFTVYLYAHEATDCRTASSTLYAVRSDGRFHRIFAGWVGPAHAKSTPQAVELPGGARGYWLIDLQSSLAYVSQAQAWHLFTYDGTQFTHVLFGGDRPEAIHWVASGGEPTVTGPQIKTSSFDSAAGIRLHHDTWTLSPDLRTATLTDSVSEMEAEVVAIQPDSVEIYPMYRRSPQEHYRETLKLSPTVEIERAGKPAALTDLQPGQRVDLTLHPWDTVIRLTIHP